MRMEQLEYFISAVQLKSLNKTAEQLYVSQSTISTALQNLEQEIGSPLLIKNYQGVEVTELGKEVYESARLILAEIARWKELASLRKLEDNHILFQDCHISMTPEGVSNQLLQVFNRLQSSNPNIKISIKEGDFLENIQDVIRRQSNFAITTIWENLLESAPIQKLIAEHNLYVEVLRRYPTMVLIHEKSELALKKNVSIKEVLQKPVVIYNKNMTAQWYEETFQAYGKLNVGIISNSITACELYLRQNKDAVLFLNALAAKRHLEKNCTEMVPKQLKEQHDYVHIYVSKNEDRDKYAVIKELLAES